MAAITSRQAPLGISSLSAALALAAISTPLDMTAVLKERDRLSEELSALGLSPLPSFTNFLFIPMDDPEKLVDQLLPFGAVTRAYPGGMRVSVRDEIDNGSCSMHCAAFSSTRRCRPQFLRYERHTAETLLSVRLRVPGQGRVLVSTGAGFYDHMLQQLAFHAGMDLRLEGVGDLETGDHHTVEDMMRTFGEALDLALGDRKGLTRYGEASVPMDEAIAHAVVDLSGRATADISVTPDEGMVAHAFESLVQTARITSARHRDGHRTRTTSPRPPSRPSVGRWPRHSRRTVTLVRPTKGSL
jgi:imidazoleglycerol phosphate dehydratase HisB